MEQLFALGFRQADFFANARRQAVQFEALGLPFVQGELAGYAVIAEFFERDRRAKSQTQIGRVEARAFRDQLNGV